MVAVGGAGGLRVLRLDFSTPPPPGAPGGVVFRVMAQLTATQMLGAGGSGSSGGGGGQGGAASLAFLVGGLVAVGTARGAVVTVGEGGVRSQLQLTGVRHGRPSAAGSGGGSSSGGAGGGGGASVDSGGGVLMMVAKGRGLVVACSDGFVYLLEPAEGGRGKGGSLHAGEGLRSARQWAFGPAGAPVAALSVSATDDQLAVAGGGGQLLLLDLNGSKEDVSAAAPGDLQDPKGASSAGAAGGRLEGGGVAGAGDAVMAHQRASAARRSSCSDGGGGGGGAAVGVFALPADEVSRPGGARACMYLIKHNSLYRVMLFAPATAPVPTPVMNAWPRSPHQDSHRDPAFVPWLGRPSIASRVSALSAASHQPLLLAVAPDERGVRVWDWARRRCVVARRLWDEPLCCGLHPGGLLAMVGTTEKLLVFHVMRVRLGSSNLGGLIVRGTEEQAN
jgi:hypothetical protein